MRFVVGILASIMRTRRQRQNLRLLAWLGLTFLVLLTVFSVMFHWLMAREGQQHSWVTAVYWTFVTMSTLGFGDITFRSDAGRLFTILVLLSGTIYLLVLLPFSVIQFVFMPWMEASQAAGTPRSLPPETRGHVLLTQLGPIEEALVPLLSANGVSYGVVVPDVATAGELLDAGYQAMVGPLDDPDTYREARVDAASLVVSTRPDTTNTNVTFTVREISASVPIVATASSAASVDILTMAGCTQVLQLGRMLGETMARRVLGRDGRARVVGRFEDLLIAEAAVGPAGIAGKTLAEVGLRTKIGVNAVGIWHRGAFQTPSATTRLHESSLLVLAGSQEQLQRYDDAFARPGTEVTETLIIGGGRVGRAAAAALEAEGLAWRLVEKDPTRIRRPDHSIVGDAARREILAEAGIDDCSAVVITPHDDDMNVYLTLYCRKLRPDVQIISRSTRERNVETLHRAGADLVMSYATTGATAISNMLRKVDILMVAEGLHVFRIDTPRDLQGKTLASSRIREQTGCTVIAVGRAEHFDGSPDPQATLDRESDLVLIGDVASESRFMDRYGKTDHARERADREPRRG
jgi:voltage-gated potassium channel